MSVPVVSCSHVSDPRLSNDTVFHSFINVQIGELVRRGDVIARMYLPAADDNGEPVDASHIHFDLGLGGMKRAPDVFDDSVVDGYCQKLFL